MNSTSAEYEGGAAEASKPETSAGDKCLDNPVEYVETPALAAHHHEPPPSLSQSTPHASASPSTPGHLWDTSSPAVSFDPTASPTSLTSIHPPPAQLTLEEACLLRYFAETLGKWVCTCLHLLPSPLTNLYSSTSVTPNDTLPPWCPNEPEPVPHYSMPFCPPQPDTSARSLPPNN